MDTVSLSERGWGFVLDTDASDKAIGAVLFFKHGTEELLCD